MIEPNDFEQRVASRLAGLPGVEAVALGGSRATPTQRPDSDWDFAIYYRNQFSPDDLRALGWPGEISEIGGWGGGVFNGGAWLTVEGRRVDVHYRDLTDVERRLAEARDGRFNVEHLLFHLAGVPTYVVVAELAFNVVLRGQLPKPDYPLALRRTASVRWWSDSHLTLEYARAAYAATGRLSQCVGAIATATCQAAHAVLAAAGEWATNEKVLIDRAGLRDVDEIVRDVEPRRESLERAVDRTRAVCTERFSKARADLPPSKPIAGQAARIDW